MTFFQAKQNGYRIKPGSKGVQVRFESYIPMDKRDDEGNIVGKKDVPYIVYHQVFNVDECVKIADTTIQALDESTGNTYHGMKLINVSRIYLMNRYINASMMLETLLYFAELCFFGSR